MLLLELDQHDRTVRFARQGGEFLPGRDTAIVVSQRGLLDAAIFTIDHLLDGSVEVIFIVNRVTGAVHLKDPTHLTATGLHPVASSLSN
jgi:hypothetical protein